MTKRIGAKSKDTPTVSQATALQNAWEHFNRELWGGSLSPVMLRVERRKMKGSGYFRPSPWAFKKTVNRAHDIVLSSEILKLDPREVFACLCHQIVHQWQHVNGESTNSSYHSQSWSDEMTRIGLTPTSNGRLNGKNTGHHMTQLVVEDGAYDLAFKAMPPDAILPWVSGIEQEDAEEQGEPREKPKPASKAKSKYGCGCSQVWGKAGINTMWCMKCHEKLTGEGSTVDPGHWEWEKKAKGLVVAFAKLGGVEVDYDPSRLPSLVIHGASGFWSCSSDTWLEAFLHLMEWMPKETSNGFDFSGVEIPVEVSESNGVLSYEQEKLEHKGEGQ